MSEFLMAPVPERISSIRSDLFSLEMSTVETIAILSMGIKIRTHDNNGLRLVSPMKEVVFAIGPGDDPEQTFHIYSSQ